MADAENCVEHSVSNEDEEQMGDYLRVRPHAPVGLGWILSGFVAAKKGADTVIEPHFVIFGRDRDEWSVKRWWAQ